MIQASSLTSNSGYVLKILRKFASVSEHSLELRAMLFFYLNIKKALAKEKQKYIEKKSSMSPDSAQKTVGEKKQGVEVT